MTKATGKATGFEFRSTATIRIRCRDPECDQFFDSPSMAIWYCPACRKRRAKAKGPRHPANPQDFRFVIVCELCGKETPSNHTRRKRCDLCATEGERLVKNARLRRLAAERRALRPPKQPRVYSFTCGCGADATAKSPRAIYCDACRRKRNTAKSERHKKIAALRRAAAIAASVAEKFGVVLPTLAVEAVPVSAPIAEPTPKPPAPPKPPKEPKPPKPPKEPKPPKQPKEPKPMKPPYVPEQPRKPAGGMCPVCYDMPHVRPAEGCPGCDGPRVEREPVRASHGGLGCGIASFPAVMR